MKDRLIAHRGDMTTYPENSLLSIQSAAKLGFTHIELDVQMSKDFKPIVIHDDNLERTTKINKYVKDLTEEQLSQYSIISSLHGHEELLKISSLKKVVEILNEYSDITLFVEIKNESIEYFDLETFVNATVDDLKTAKFNIVIISFNQSALEYARLQSQYQIGWVIKKYNDTYRKIAEKLEPSYIFCNVKKIIRPKNLWPGPWSWALYDIMNPSFAYELLEQGVSFIETGDIVKLSNAEEFIP